MFILISFLQSYIYIVRLF